jgi:hypothetical protein
LTDAVLETAKRLDGSFAIAVLSTKEPDRIVEVEQVSNEPFHLEILKLRDSLLLFLRLLTTPSSLAKQAKVLPQTIKTKTTDRLKSIGVANAKFQGLCYITRSLHVLLFFNYKHD